MAGTVSPCPIALRPPLASLIRSAETAAAQHPANLGARVAALKRIIASDVDPYLRSGALIETIVHWTVGCSIATTRALAARLKVAPQTGTALLRELQGRGVVREVTGRGSFRAFAI
jgi:hypothetical protein